jgi:hypothetical protein
MLCQNLNNLRNLQAAYAPFNCAASVGVLRARIRYVSALPVAIFMDPPWGMYKPYIDVMQPSSPEHPNILAWLAALWSEATVQFIVVKVPKRYMWDNAKTPEGWHFSQNCALSKMEMLVFRRLPKD